MEGSAVTLASILEAVTSIFSTVIGFVTDVAGAITSNPLLLMFVLIPLIGLGVGMFRRLLNVN